VEVLRTPHWRVAFEAAQAALSSKGKGPSVPGKHLNDQQVRMYMDHRRSHSQETAAAKAGISERTARRIDGDPTLPSQRKQPRAYRTRANPFESVWAAEVAPLLQAMPGLQAITILRELQRRHPGQFPDSQLRTLQRHIRHWSGLYGPDRDVIFRQEHPPGAQGLSDFTDASELGVRLAGESFAHRLYHFVLAHSQWEYARVVEGGESFSALAEGLQNALWLIGGVPLEHRTDSLSAAFKNLTDQEDFTRSYRELCAHYGMTATRNNRGVSHENGSVESPHGHLKTALDQALMLRGSRDFDSRPAYQEFVDELVAARNVARERAFAADRAALMPLPKRRTIDFSEVSVIVPSSSMISVRKVSYTVPSRLIGHSLKVHLYDDRLECFLGSTAVLTLPRGRVRSGGKRGYVINYRHVLPSLRRKPQALRNLVWRDELFPRPAFRRSWDTLTERLSIERACKTMVALLDIAYCSGCEAELAEQIDRVLDAGELPDPTALRSLFVDEAHNSRGTAGPPMVSIMMPTAPVYDVLLPATCGGR